MTSRVDVMRTTRIKIAMRLIAAMVGIGVALGAIAMMGGCASRPVTKRQPAITPPASFRGAADPLGCAGGDAMPRRSRI